MRGGHAMRRAYERYGVSLSSDEMRLLADKIIVGLCEQFERENRRVRKVFVEANGVELPVVFNDASGRILTVLPPDAAEVRRAYAKRADRANKGQLEKVDG